MLKNFLMKKMLKAQLKNMPKDQAQMVERMMEKDPELFMKMAQETQALVKGGKDQMAAMMEVSKKYRADIERLMR